MRPRPWRRLVLSVAVIGTFCGQAWGLAYDWSFTVLDNGGQHSSIAVDHADLPHVVYQGQNGQLYYRRLVSTSYDLAWQSQTIDSGDNVGRYCRIVAQTWDVDPQVGPWTDFHVAYLDAESEEVKYAYKAPWSPWSLETVGGGVNILRRCGLAVKSSGNPLIVFVDAAGRVKATTRGTTGWDAEELDNGPDCRLPGVVVDESDQPNVTYVKPSGDNDNEDVWVKYHVETLDTWNSQPVLLNRRVGPACDPLVDDNGNLRVIVALKSPSQVVEALPFGQEGKFRVIADDNVPLLDAIPVLRHLFHSVPENDTESLHLLLVKPTIIIHSWEESPLHSEVLDNGTFLEGTTCGFVVDSLGNLHVTYYDAEAGQLIYAYGQVIPEPATMLFFFTGLGALAALRARRMRTG